MLTGIVQAVTLLPHAVTCTYQVNEYALYGLLPVLREIRTIISTKLLAQENLVNRRSQTWYQQSVANWLQEINEQRNFLTSALQQYSASAQQTTRNPLLRTKIALINRLLDGLIKATTDYSSDLTSTGDLRSTCQAALEILSDAIEQIENSHRTLTRQTLGQPYKSAETICQDMIKTGQTDWLVELADADLIIPMRSALESEEIPEIYRADTDTHRPFADRAIGIAKAG